MPALGAGIGVQGLLVGRGRLEKNQNTLQAIQRGDRFYDNGFVDVSFARFHNRAYRQTFGINLVEA